jgi:hypothetical protein
MFNILSHKGNASQSNNGIHLTIIRMAIINFLKILGKMQGKMNSFTLHYW